MNKRNRLEGTPIKQIITTGQLVTVEDLESFKKELLIALQGILSQYITPLPRKWLKTYEVRELLGVSPGTLQTLRNNGTIPFSKIGGIIYYDANEVDKLLQSQKRDFRNIQGCS